MKTVLTVAVASLLALPAVAAFAAASPNGIYLPEQNKHHDHSRDHDRKIEHCHIRVVKHWRGNQLIVDKQKVCD